MVMKDSMNKPDLHLSITCSLKIIQSKNVIEHDHYEKIELRKIKSIDNYVNLSDNVLLRADF